MYYSEEQARALVIEAGHRLLETKLIARTWGNISARISEDWFIITPSGRAYDTLMPEELVKVNVSDCSWDGDVKPSSEKKVHAEAYRLRKDAAFVIHTHQFYASAVGAEGRDTAFAPCAAYGLPGTDRLKNNVAAAIEKHPASKAFLMEKHGALCIGGSYDEAFAIAGGLEDEAKALFERRVPNYKAGESFIAAGAAADYPFCVYVSEPFTCEWSRRNTRLRAYIDDFAQIAGPDARVAPNRALQLSWALKDRNAAMVKDLGGVCVGAEADDAQAVAMILEKNCAAALYVRNAKPLSYADAMLQRVIYLTKYSKQKSKV